jgi:hypothetical protein
VDRIALVIQRLTRVRHHPAHVWALLRHRLGWSVQRPSAAPPSVTRTRSTSGEKATLLWDGLPAHRSRAMRAWIRTQRSWLVVERLPAYAPELNPVEGLWSCLKAVELANLTGPTLAEAINQAHQGIDRVRRPPHLAYSFLRHTGLSVP